jgi:hypothetical protein
MKLEQQVTNLELSKKLKELGVPQESLFYLQRMRNGNHPNDRYSPWQFKMEKDIDRSYEYYSAFTAAELGEMLPWDIVISRNIDRAWIVTFQANGLTEKEMASYIEKSEVDARAKMLIYLIENSLIKL